MMRLLITTQAVDLDEPALANFHRWIEEFAQRCESVHVICLKEGRHTLPTNVHVYSLGKAAAMAPSGRVARIVSRVKYVSHFYSYVWRLRSSYDAVFVHMNPEYVILAGWWWRLQRRRIVMWYVHRQKSLMLRAAVFLVNTVCTTAKESIGVVSPKIVVMGHGIDVVQYTSQEPKVLSVDAPRIVSVGRITPIKNLEVIVDAVAQLRERSIAATLDLVGVPTVATDFVYEKKVRDHVSELHLDTNVSFIGVVKNEDMPSLYPQYDFSVNACPTGGIDKAVLESMATGTIPLVCNVAFRDYFGSHADALLFEYRDAHSLTEKIAALLSRDDLPSLQQDLRARAREKADVTVLIEGIHHLLFAQ